MQSAKDYLRRKYLTSVNEVSDILEF